LIHVVKIADVRDADAVHPGLARGEDLSGAAGPGRKADPELDDGVERCIVLCVSRYS
jgi:hypothetical protein